MIHKDELLKDQMELILIAVETDMSLEATKSIIRMALKNMYELGKHDGTTDIQIKFLEFLKGENN